MKKLIKWSLIIGVAICLVGVGMITTGAMMGGGEGLVSYLGSHHAAIGWYNGWYGEDWDWDSGRLSAGASGSLPEDAGSYVNISKLEIESAAGTIELVEEQRNDPNDKTVRIARTDRQENSRSHYDIIQDGEELKIHVRSRARNIKNEDVESLAIYVPAGYRFRKVDVETSAGGFYAEALYSDEVELTLRAGEMIIDRGEIADLDVECAAGQLVCGASVSRSADAECQAGSVNIRMAGTKDQYNYKLECKTGTITLADEEEERYTGIWQKEYIDHSAANKVDLECAAGEIVVYFPDSV